MGADVTALAANLRGAEFHRIIRDGSRLKMLTSLHEAGELDAEALAQTLLQDIEETRRTLGELAGSGLLAERRERFRVHYRLADGLPAWVSIALGAARNGGLAPARMSDAV